MPGYSDETQYPKGIATQIGAGTLVVAAAGSKVKVNEIVLSSTVANTFTIRRGGAGATYVAPIVFANGTTILGSAEYPDGLEVVVPANGNATVFYFNG